MVVDVFLAQEPSGWRLYFAEDSWCPPMLRAHLDDELEAKCARDFGAEDLHEFMWRCDAPYEISASKAGGAQVVARGRSAVVLSEWLLGLLAGTDR